MSKDIKSLFRGVLGLFLGLAFVGTLFLFLQGVLTGNSIHFFGALGLLFLCWGITRAVDFLSD
jgi:hypothetical protein